MEHPKKERQTPNKKNRKNPDNKKPVIKQAHDKEKFSPGEPDAYDAEKFATD